MLKGESLHFAVTLTFMVQLCVPTWSSPGPTPESTCTGAKPSGGLFRSVIRSFLATPLELFLISYFPFTAICMQRTSSTETWNPTVSFGGSFIWLLSSKLRKAEGRLKISTGVEISVSVMLEVGLVLSWFVTHFNWGRAFLSFMLFPCFVECVSVQKVAISQM